MQEETGENRHGKTQCINGQEAMVSAMLENFVDYKFLRKEIYDLTAKVDINDKKHTAAIDDLRKFFVDQNLVIVDSVGELKISIDAISKQLEPLVSREEKAKLFILKWSLPIIGFLLAIIAFGDKAKVLIDIFKAVK